MRAGPAVILLLAVASARADDAPAQGADSIAAAKKDFAAIKSSALAPDATSSLPTLDMKDVGPAPGAAPSAPAPLPAERDASLDSTKKGSTTGNWLVDAMDKDKASGRAQPSRPGDERLKGDTDLTLDPDRADSERADGAKDGASGSQARDSGGPREPAEHVYNPLDSFMGNWISAHDHDLLVPTSKGEAPAGAESAPRGDAPGVVDPMPSGSLTEMLLPAPDAASWADSKPEANPFLAPADPETAPAVKFFTGADASGFAPFGLADPVPGMASPGAAAQPSDTPRTFLPDFAQPSDDDKYFRQMKRF